MYCVIYYNCHLDFITNLLMVNDRIVITGCDCILAYERFGRFFVIFINFLLFSCFAIQIYAVKYDEVNFLIISLILGKLLSSSLVIFFQSTRVWPWSFITRPQQIINWWLSLNTEVVDGALRKMLNSSKYGGNKHQNMWI